MPKKVKTRKQKILTDSRRKTHALTTPQEAYPTYSLPEKTLKTSSRSISSKSEPAITSTTSHVSTAGYSYLLKDLRKTLILTFSIIVAQLLISYFMR